MAMEAGGGQAGGRTGEEDRPKVNRYGLFNDLRTSPSDSAFFAIQVAVSSYREDPLRKNLDTAVAEISTTSEHEKQSSLAAAAADQLAHSVQFIEYCVWDYTMVKSVAHKEFASWVDDIQEIAASAADPDDVTSFLKDDTSYFVATLAVLSAHSSLRSWLSYYPPRLQGHEFFERKTIGAILKQMGGGHSKILTNCVNAMFTVMPVSANNFYAGKELRSNDWDYMRPVY
jgi:hypothetical protein